MEREGIKTVYGACQKNHAALLGEHSTDGCLEYLQDTTNPQMLYCMACDCHRNFHSKSPLPNADVVSGGIGVATEVLCGTSIPCEISRGTSAPGEVSSGTNLGHMVYRKTNRWNLKKGELSKDSKGFNMKVLARNQALNLQSPRDSVGEPKTKNIKVYTPFQESEMWKLAENLGWKMPDFDPMISAKSALDCIGIKMESFQHWMDTTRGSQSLLEKPRVPDLN